jgi:hypothetical protein
LTLLYLQGTGPGAPLPPLRDRPLQGSTGDLHSEITSTSIYTGPIQEELAVDLNGLIKLKILKVICQYDMKSTIT